MGSSTWLPNMGMVHDWCNGQWGTGLPEAFGKTLPVVQVSSGQTTVSEVFVQPVQNGFVVTLHTTATATVANERSNINRIIQFDLIDLKNTTEVETSFPVESGKDVVWNIAVRCIPNWVQIIALDTAWAQAFPLPIGEI